MTGIERLRKLSEDMLSLSLWLRLTTRTEKDWDCYQGDGRTVNDELLSIADQIEREQAEDSEAIAWVREHGGLDAVKRRWGCLDYYADPVPRSCMERRLARLQRQIDESHAALRRRNEELKRFENANATLLQRGAEMKRRLMPEGMEWLLEVWPKWSNGEYCKFGDWWTADKYGDYEPKQLRRLVFYTPEQLREWEQDEGDNFGYEWDFMRPSDTTYRPDKAEPPKRCRDCAHWQKDPTADNMGVCWFFYHEYEGEDCYAARRADIGACEEFMPSAKALAERERGE